MASSRNACGKLVFRTKRDAKYGRSRIAHAKGRKIYLCPECGFFHLTSMKLSDQVRFGYRDDGVPAPTLAPVRSRHAVRYAVRVAAALPRLKHHGRPRGRCKRRRPPEHRYPGRLASR
jgi:hypothetical protein